MRYPIVDAIRLRDDLVITIDGSGEGIENGSVLRSEKGEFVKIKSAGIPAGLIDAHDLLKVSSYLVEGTPDVGSYLEQ